VFELDAELSATVDAAAFGGGDEAPEDGVVTGLVADGVETGVVTCSVTALVATAWCRGVDLCLTGFGL
jgi:hypothetical protein